MSLSELISEGNIGLIKAIEKFDPEKDIKLISMRFGGSNRG
jgi:RNA polymerase primary sigma factor